MAKKINLLFGKIILNEYDVAVGALFHDFYYTSNLALLSNKIL